MKNDVFDRRTFLKRAVAGSAAAVIVAQPQPTPAQQTTPAPAQQGAPAPAPQSKSVPEQSSMSAPYAYLNLQEQAFVEALVDHMVPADVLSPKGTDIGINIYIDRALAGGWGKGERLYMQGPWKRGTPNQGYQLPLTPAQLYRAGIEATNAHCRKTYGKTFDALTEAQREEVLVGLSTNKIKFDSGLPTTTFWNTVYQTVMQGMFADPIYGGNRNKAGWKMIGFPGVIAVHRENVEKYRDKKYTADILGIADLS